MSYGKIFESVFTGSMYGSGPLMFATWAYVIAHCRPPGVVELNPRRMADQIGTTVEAIKAAIESLCEPDPDSRNSDQDGRRLVPMGGLQYRVVSFKKYREMRDADQRREYQRQWDKENRPSGHSRETPDRSPTTVRPESDQNPTAVRPQSDHGPTTVRPHSDTVRHSPTKAEAEAEVITPPTPRKRGAVGELFAVFWEAYPRKTSKGSAEKAFAKINPNEQLVGRMRAAIERAKTSDQWRKENGTFIPYPATWLNARGWEDEAPASEGGEDWLRHVL